jgi:hypothetical protein
MLVIYTSVFDRVPKKSAVGEQALRKIAQSGEEIATTR